MAVHETHPQIVKRLRRIEGHVRTIAVMIEEGRSCAEVAQQMHAVERALHGAKETFIRDHLDHCLDEAVATKGKSLREFKEITKYL